jgi:hypothetical protein
VADYLLEAHLFKGIKIAEDVKELVLSRQKKSVQTPWTEAEWRTITTNATEWCKRNKVRLLFASS